MKEKRGMSNLMDKAELFTSDGRSYVVHLTAKDLVNQMKDTVVREHYFHQIETIDGRKVYINPKFVISITEYNYPVETFSYFDDDKEKSKMVENKKVKQDEATEKAAYNKKAAEQFKKEIGNIE